MIFSEHNLNATAEAYSKHHGCDAYQRIGEDISMAVGNREWDNAHMLQQVQRRVRKLERLGQIAVQLHQHPTQSGCPK